MTAANKPARNSPPDTTPTIAQLEEATRRSAIAKTNARNAKAAFKNARKTFKLARKAAKAARKKADALRKAIAGAEEAAAVAAARKTSGARHPRRKDLPRASADSKPPLPVQRKSVPKASRTSSSPILDTEGSPADDATLNPAAALDGWMSAPSLFRWASFWTAGKPRSL